MNRGSCLRRNLGAKALALNNLFRVSFPEPIDYPRTNHITRPIALPICLQAEDRPGDAGDIPYAAKACNCPPSGSLMASRQRRIIRKMVRTVTENRSDASSTERFSNCIVDII